MVRYNKFQLSTNDTKWIFSFFQRQSFWVVENEDGSKPYSTIQVYTIEAMKGDTLTPVNLTQSKKIEIRKIVLLSCVSEINVGASREVKEHEDNVYPQVPRESVNNA